MVRQKLLSFGEKKSKVKSKSGNEYEVVTEVPFDQETRDSVKMEWKSDNDVWVEVEFRGNAGYLTEIGMDCPDKPYVSQNEDRLWKEWEEDFYFNFDGDEPAVYTAGSMDTNHWRDAVDEGVDGISFVHPTQTYFKHGGDFVCGCVSEDLVMVRKCDGFIAYFDSPDQVGTMVELFEAFRRRKNILVIFEEGNEGVYEYSDHEGYHDLTKQDFGVNFHGTSRKYWFLLNYLVGDGGDKAFSGVDKEIPAWTGRQHVKDKDLSVYSVSSHEDAVDVVEEWVEKLWLGSKKEIE